jgi:hypothetical protein
VRLRATPLLMAGIGLQILIVSVVPGGSHALHAIAHVLSYALVGGFVVANRRIPFIWAMALGGTLNFIAIAANHGVMPASPRALATAGIVQDAADFSNSTAVASPQLSALGDVFAVPAAWPASNVFSVGDVLLLAGAFLCLHAICGSRLALRRPGRTPRSAGQRA